MKILYFKKQNLYLYVWLFFLFIRRHKNVCTNYCQMPFETFWNSFAQAPSTLSQRESLRGANTSAVRTVGVLGDPVESVPHAMGAVRLWRRKSQRLIDC